MKHDATFLSIADPIKYREVFNLFRLKNAFSRGRPEFCMNGIINTAVFIALDRVVTRDNMHVADGKVSIRGNTMSVL